MFESVAEWLTVFQFDEEIRIFYDPEGKPGVV